LISDTGEILQNDLFEIDEE